MGDQGKGEGSNRQVGDRGRGRGRSRCIGELSQKENGSAKYWRVSVSWTAMIELAATHWMMRELHL